jgi:hypothetical protein
MMPTPHLTPVELIYRKLSQPSPPQPARVSQEPKLQPELTRDEVDAIIQRKRSATPEQLQAIIDRAQHYRLSTWQRNQLGVDIGVALAAKARGRPNSDSVFKSSSTTFWIMPTRHSECWPTAASSRISLSVARKEFHAAGQTHHPPRGACWAPQRQMLWHVQSVYGDRSPEAYVGGRIWEALEEMEVAARPHRAGQ